MSSVNYTSEIGIEGIFDGDRLLTSLWGANKAYVQYCSSDGWLGTLPPVTPHLVTNFCGQSIVRSALDDLMTRSLITSDSNSVCWWLGGSSRHDESRGLPVVLSLRRSPSGWSLLGFTLLDRCWKKILERTDPINTTSYEDEDLTLYAESWPSRTKV